MKMVDADGDHEIHLKNEKLKASVSEGQESQNKERCWKSWQWRSWYFEDCNNEDNDILKIVTMKIMAWKMEIMTMKTCFSNKLVHEPPKRWTWAEGLQWWRSSPPSPHNHHDHPIKYRWQLQARVLQGQDPWRSLAPCRLGNARPACPSLITMRMTVVMMVMDDGHGDDGDYGEMEVNNCKTWDTGAWWADALESSCKKQYCVTPAKCEYWKGNTVFKYWLLSLIEYWNTEKEIFYWGRTVLFWPLPTWGLRKESYLSSFW